MSLFDQTSSKNSTTLTDMHLVWPSAVCFQHLYTIGVWAHKKTKAITINHGLDFTFGTDSTFCYVLVQ